jgi:5-methylcytosine-specific restriction endonuclease McrA
MASKRDDLQTESWRKKIRPYILERDGHTCQACSNPVDGADATIDHIIPKAITGVANNTASNLQTLCRSCNSKKGIKSNFRRAFVKPGWGITL